MGSRAESMACLICAAISMRLARSNFWLRKKCTSRIHEITHSKSPAKQVELEADKLIVKERVATSEMVAQTALQL